MAKERWCSRCWELSTTKGLSGQDSVDTHPCGVSSCFGGFTPGPQLLGTMKELQICLISEKGSKWPQCRGAKLCFTQPELWVRPSPSQEALPALGCWLHPSRSPAEVCSSWAASKQLWGFMSCSNKFTKCSHSWEDWWKASHQNHLRLAATASALNFLIYDLTHF